MSDLISRSELIKDLKECLDEENIQHTLEYFGVYDIIRSQETVEAKPVVHGEWIDTCPEYHGGYKRNAHKCSNCGDYYTTEPEDLFFCPRCGADMRGKKNE